MGRMRRHSAVLICGPVLFAFLATISGVSPAHDRSAEIPGAERPENAHAKRYGVGWECDYGYRAVDGACVAIRVPANGYLFDSSYGPGWRDAIAAIERSMTLAWR